MAPLARVLAVLSALAIPHVAAHDIDVERPVNHGLIGYGIDMYKPNCAVSCRATISTSPLECSTSESTHDMAMAEMDEEMTTSDTCYATDDTFLQDMAYCLSTKCTDTPVWKLEEWWSEQVVGGVPGQASPKESYQQALAAIKTLPTQEMVSGDPLYAFNRTMFVNEEDYAGNFNGQEAFETAVDTHERFGLIILLSCFIIPLATSLLRFVPFPSSLTTKFNAYIIDPPHWGTQHKQPVAGLMLIPTRGQALFICYVIIINVVLCAAGYKSIQPNAWFSDTHSEILTYVANRTGVLSFANLPLVFLYAGRNNILLSVTNWNHNTFLLLHRWIASIATLQAVVHSAIYLQNRLDSAAYSMEATTPYWVWGSAATVALSLAIPMSILPLRKKMYEFFLLCHIALAVVTIAGCYLHIYYRFAHQWGYELWILVAIALWAYDHVARVARILRNGLRLATVSIIDDDYVRVNIPGVAAEGHAYLYFPTLSWKFWESHPFSVASALLQEDHNASRKSSDVEKANALSMSSTKEMQVNIAPASTTSNSSMREAKGRQTLGLTFLIRTRSGLTKLIRNRLTIPVLVESSYNQHESTSDYPYLVAIGGGVGVTALLPYVRKHVGVSKLYWGVRTPALVQSNEVLLAGIDKEVFVRERMPLRELVEDVVETYGVAGVAIVVSGPASMADEVRNLVSEIGRRGGSRKVKLIEEAFSR